MNLKYLSDRLLDRVDALGSDQGAGSALVAAAEHSLAQNAGDRADDVAHGFQLRPGDLVVVAKAQAILAEDRADRLDVARPPGVQHLVEPLLGVENVLESQEEVRVALAELSLNLIIQSLVFDVG